MDNYGKRRDTKEGVGTRIQTNIRRERTKTLRGQRSIPRSFLLGGLTDQKICNDVMFEQDRVVNSVSTGNLLFFHFYMCPYISTTLALSNT